MSQKMISQKSRNLNKLIEKERERISQLEKIQEISRQERIEPPQHLSDIRGRSNQKTYKQQQESQFSRFLKVAIPTLLLTGAGYKSYQYEKKYKNLKRINQEREENELNFPKFTQAQLAKALEIIDMEKKRHFISQLELSHNKIREDEKKRLGIENAPHYYLNPNAVESKFDKEAIIRKIKANEYKDVL